MPVSLKQVGSLSAANIVTVCANHHREVHYGEASVTIGETAFSFVIAGHTFVIPRTRISLPPDLHRELDGEEELPLVFVGREDATHSLCFNRERSRK